VWHRHDGELGGIRLPLFCHSALMQGNQWVGTCSSCVPRLDLTSFLLLLVPPVFLQPSYPIKVYKPEGASATSTA